MTDSKTTSGRSTAWTPGAKFPISNSGSGMSPSDIDRQTAVEASVEKLKARFAGAWEELGKMKDITPIWPIKPHTRKGWCICGKPLVWGPEPVYQLYGWWCPDFWNCRGKEEA